MQLIAILFNTNTLINNACVLIISSSYLRLLHVYLSIVHADCMLAIRVESSRSFTSSPAIDVDMGFLQVRVVVPLVSQQWQWVESRADGPAGQSDSQFLLLKSQKC
jgi:hypothetical protein